ncbi:MAG TPA: Gfo/Idh/MocA family oxidoreductase [Gemmatimonadaceae bacterium]|nr:Gfo/Idh/MocA family oxidoreductase [Gemmatimonadaceae bacterium]
MSARNGIVIVGAGLMGQWHAHAAHALGERVRAVVDTDLTRAQTLAKEYEARATTDLADALGTQPFAAHICTPLDAHVAQASAALDAGAHVIVEKPFALTPADTRALLSRAASAKLHAVPVHQYLFQTGTREALDELANFGPPLHADFVACSAGADATNERSRIARDILPHAMSVLRRVHGPSFSAIQWSAVEPAQGELRVTAAADGSSISILISMSGRPTQNTARLIGEHGTVHLDFFHGFATFESPDVSRAHKIARPFTLGAKTLANAATNLATRALQREPAYPGLRELVSAFYSAARANTAPPISAEEAIDVAVAVEKIG